jgi:hypothetical protein
VDPQQRRVYKWEGSFRSFYERTTTRDSCRKLIQKATRRYNVPPPGVYFKTKQETRGNITSEYDPITHRITIGWCDCNHAIALHEAAHAITDWLYGEDLHAHGDRWLGIYLDLLEWAKVAPRSALHASARERRLRWKPVRRTLHKGR